MKAEVHLIPILQDNYVFVVRRGNEAIVIDPGEAAPVIDFIHQNNLRLIATLITHHHPDHIDGLKELKRCFEMPIYASLANRELILLADFFVEDQQILNFLGLTFHIISTPGHTLGHIVYWQDDMKWLFSGDVIFGLGCGRLFEGSYDQAFATLQKIKVLPSNTMIFCAHDYAEANLRFCKRFKPPFDDLIPHELLDQYEDRMKALYKNGLPSVPLFLDIEKTVNPFFLAKNLDHFTQLRQLRNHFR